MAALRVRVGGRALAAALTVASLAAGGACAVQAAGAWLAFKDPDAALRWGLANPDALSALAEERFADARRPGHDAEALRYAHQAVLAAPLDERALRVLALEKEKAGGLTRARMLMVIVDQRTRRDYLAQSWLFEHALREGDWRNASLHADALLRHQGRLEGFVIHEMISALRDPSAVAPFVDRLIERPDWRGGFLQALAWHAADRDAAARVFEALAATDAPPTDQEIGELIGRYVAQGDYRGARSLWTQLLPRGAASASGLVYNGDFRSVPGSPPFNWKLIQSDGATVEIGPAADGASALHVLAPAAPTTTMAEQLLNLGPGAYRLSGMALLAPGQSGDLFAWRMACAGQDDNSSMAEARQPGGPTGWRPFAISFEVPSHGCDAQWLRLVGLARDGFEPAEAWYKAVRVQPAGPAGRFAAVRERDRAGRQMGRVAG